MIKANCRDCGSSALVLDGKLLCCDALLSSEPTRVKRECASDHQRRLPPLADRRSQLKLQQNHCFYCDRIFGSRVYRGARLTRLRVEWDHVIPYSYCEDNCISNFVAACHVCNAIKSSHVFSSLESARAFINSKW